MRQKSSEHYHLMFLRANFQDLLELLQDSEGLLSEESVKALGFVFSAAKNSRECPLYELAVLAASHSGYSMVSVELSLMCVHYNRVSFFCSPPPPTPHVCRSPKASP